ncbi:uncharacterized protein Tco025E_02539 [Trypanosoma conorhini]|uniref:CYTH domain-containing protein n=1 Tax=Trypanosoma conorhini TaxID=83891 RepID=A0A422Q3D5_9TRYP|nr:uncharacterized protein Tco025E_02539 [Trypanosoma conorhini]RNF24442.1 hypothetical protein Tco025E_02539 [Trypanosoma conorhini]
MATEDGMKFAVKLRLEDESDFDRLSQALSLRVNSDEVYKDYFFDFTSRRLSHNSGVLRLRVPVAGTETAATTLPSLTLKERNIVERGDQMYTVHQVPNLPEEVKEELLAGKPFMEVLRRCCHCLKKEQAAKMSSIIKGLEDSEKTPGAAGPIEIVDSLKSHRRVYGCALEPRSGNVAGANEYSERTGIHMLGGTIRLDETDFPFGKRYEIEVVDFNFPVGDVRKELESFLHLHNINYSESLESKCSTFMKYLEGFQSHSEDIAGVLLRISGDEGYEEAVRWLENKCSTIALNPQTVGLTQGSTYPSSQAGAVCSYLSGQRALPMSAHSGQDIFSQSLHQCSQLSSEREMNPNSSVDERQKCEDYEEYQENFYFDSSDRILDRRRCEMELRYSSQRQAFMLSLKQSQSVEDGSQNANTLRGTLSGDMARELLRSPTRFLKDRRRDNCVAEALWDEFNMRELFVLGFCQTMRRGFTRPVTVDSQLRCLREKRRRQPSDDDDVDPEPQRGRLQTDLPPLTIHLDNTLIGRKELLKKYVEDAAESPSCTIASSPALPKGKDEKRVYEVGVSKLPKEIQQAVKNWFLSKMHKLGVECELARRTKLEQCVASLPKQ